MISQKPFWGKGFVLFTMLMLSALFILPICSFADDPHGIVNVTIPLLTWNTGDINIAANWDPLEDIHIFVFNKCNECKLDDHIDSIEDILSLFPPPKLIGLQEDWCWHFYNLKNTSFSSFEYHTPPSGSPGDIVQDAMTVFSEYKVKTGFLHTSWYPGDLTGWDYYSMKGFVYGRLYIQIGEHYSFPVDFYSVHTNSDFWPTASEARRRNIEQLAAFIETHSKGYPVIIVGDFNLYFPYFNENTPLNVLYPSYLRYDQDTYTNFTNRLGLSTANDIYTWTHPEFHGQCFDLIMYRGADNITLTKKMKNPWQDETIIRYPNAGVPCNDHKFVYTQLDYSVNVDAFPDLQVTDIEYHPEVNGSPYVLVTIKNFGPGATPNNNSIIGIPVTCNFGESVTNSQTQTKFLNQPLQNGESATISFELGSYDPGNSILQVGAIVDKVDIIIENNEENNILIKRFDQNSNDLKIIDLYTIPATPVAGDSVEIVATIQNTGNVATPVGVSVEVGAWVDNYYVGSFTVKDPDGTLAPGETSMEKVSGFWTAVEGSHTFRANADPNNLITESNEDNNSHSVVYNIEKTFTITATSGLNGTINPSGAVKVTKGSSQSFAITPNAGYAIASVVVDGSPITPTPASPYTIPNVQADHTIHATFAPLGTYTITATAGPNGTINPSGAVSVTAGSSQQFTITPDSGYSIASVVVDGSPITPIPTSPYNFPNVQADHTIHVTFAPQATYTITATAGPNGTINPSGAVTVNAGSTQQFAITPDAGYAIASIVVDGSPIIPVPTSPYTFPNVQADHTIHVTFSQISLLNVTSPTGADWVEANSRVPQQIRWTYSPSQQGKLVHIYLLNEAQQQLAALAYNVPIGNMSIGWWVAQNLKDGWYYIKINTTDGQASALSERFYIHFRFCVTFPGPGDWVQSDSGTIIRWEYSSSLVDKTVTFTIIYDNGATGPVVGRNIAVAAGSYGYWMPALDSGWYSIECVINDGKNPAYSEKFNIYR